MNRHPIATLRAYYAVAAAVTQELARIVPQIVPELVDRHVARSGRRDLWQTIHPGTGPQDWARLVDHARQAGRHSGHSLDAWLDAFTVLAQLGWTRADVLALDPAGLGRLGDTHDRARDIAWALDAARITWHR